MSNPLYANICGKTLAALFRMWRDAGQSVNEELTNLTSAISPPVQTTPALPDRWRLIERSNTVHVLLADGSVLPGTDIKVSTDSDGWSPASYSIDDVDVSEILTGLMSQRAAGDAPAELPARPVAQPESGARAVRFRKRRVYAQPQQTRARKVLKELYPDRYPTQEEVANGELLHAFGKRIKEMIDAGRLPKSGRAEPSDSSVLRELGRKVT